MRAMLARTAVVILGAIVALGAVPPVQAEAAVHTKSVAKEKKRVDRVAAPSLSWTSCGSNVACAYASLPLDYDSPKGAKINVLLARYRSPSQTTRLGTLFFNPGGPGVSGVDAVKQASSYFSANVLKYYDIVGFDPRGTGGSTALQCFSDASAMRAAMSGLQIDFPQTHAQKVAFKASAKKLAKACSSKSNKQLASSMSTSEVARDLDVLRRAVGDSKLNYFGLSYGTYIGEVYAAMFPDRVRTMVLDGLVDPYGWRGSSSTSTPVTLRLGAAAASQTALNVALSACAAAGADHCPIMPDPAAAFKRAAASLKKTSIAYSPFVLQTSERFTYNDFISWTVQFLELPDGAERLANMVAEVLAVFDGQPRPSKPAGHVGTSQRFSPATFSAYDTSDDGYYAVMCSDSANPRNQSAWTSAVAQYASSAPSFAAYWGYASLPCGTASWKAKDEDAYSGSFYARTANPVLLVGNYYDPATPYANAVSVKRYLTNSVLLANAAAGHTAYGQSNCVTTAVDNYLLSLKPPAAGTVCAQELSLFTKSIK
ncbi:MAG: alpha/beta hydrolase [Propionibacteriaceae bacterium]|jgi:pimeloyl-ACP methyl ester carboxylesterase|nr:alpha/beta hydrolase [Propionibacteriaceae bacterium]